MRKLSARVIRSLVVGSLAAAFVLTTSAYAQTVRGGASESDSAARARQLWEAAVAAKGGRERLRNVKSLFVKAELSGGDRNYELHVFPDYGFDYSYVGKKEITTVTVRNARRGVTWWQPNGSEAQELKYDENDAYGNLKAQLVYLLVTHDIDPTPLRSRKEWLGLRRVDVVETDASGWRVDYYLDPDTHLPLRVTLPSSPKTHAEGKMNAVISLEDYADVGGVMMPRKATRSSTTNPSKWTERLTFEINPSYDEGIFGQPPNPKMGGEAWRPKTGG
jgi:hypothetical protein